MPSPKCWINVFFYQRSPIQNLEINCKAVVLYHIICWWHKWLFHSFTSHGYFQETSAFARLWACHSSFHLKIKKKLFKNFKLASQVQQGNPSMSCLKAMRIWRLFFISKVPKKKNITIFCGNDVLYKSIGIGSKCCLNLTMFSSIIYKLERINLIQ